MRVVDDLRDVRREYVELVRIDGAEVTELKRFKQSLLELNRRHRLEGVVAMYVRIISRIETRKGKRRS